jgi:AcrR family transcriptional regulator
LIENNLLTAAHYNYTDYGVITHSVFKEVNMELHIDQWPKKKLAIIEATITTLAEEGFDKTTTARIAKSAGVGEGTIYRHFRNKDDLIGTTALYTASLVFGPARQNFDQEASVHAQFIQFCRDFLSTGLGLPLHHAFMEQYLNSPIGIEYRKKTLDAVLANPNSKPIFYPMNRILMKGKEQEIVKDFPLQILVALSMGPMMFILKHSGQGFMELDDELIIRVAKSCWDGIRR